MYTTIPIDFEVYKKLTSLLKDENDTYNRVLRERLEMETKELAKPDGIPWVSKGVVFPHGTEFRAAHKGQTYEGRVENGALVINNQRFNSPSAAAVFITGNPVNGWLFWECKRSGETTWRTMASLRKQGKPGATN
jgi:hypothetical protein